MGFIAKSDYEKIVAQNKKKNIATNKYLTDIQDPNFLYIKGKFFANDVKAEEKAKLFNVGSGLGYAMCDTIANRVSEPQIGEKTELKEAVKDLVALGFACVSFEEMQAGGKLRLIALDSENYWNDGEDDKVLTHYIQKQNNQLMHYRLVKTYKVGQITSELWEYTSEDATKAYKVELNKIQDTAREIEVIKTIPGKNSMFVFGDYRARDYVEGYGWVGDNTLLDVAMPTIYSCDRYRILFDTQYMLHTEQYKIFKGVFPEITETNTFSGKKNEGTKQTSLQDYSKTGKNLVSQDPNATVEIVNNQNPLVEQARTYYQEQIQYLSGLVSIPVEFLMGELHTGNMGADSRSIIQEQFLSLVESYRDILDMQLPEILQVLKTRNANLMEEYMRPDVFMKDKKTMLEQIQLEDATKINTKVRQIMEYHDLSQEEAVVLYQDIRNETTAVNDDTTNP